MHLVVGQSLKLWARFGGDYAVLFFHGAVVERSHLRVVRLVGTVVEAGDTAIAGVYQQIECVVVELKVLAVFLAQRAPGYQCAVVLSGLEVAAAVLSSLRAVVSSLEVRVGIGTQAAHQLGLASQADDLALHHGARQSLVQRAGADVGIGNVAAAQGGSPLRSIVFALSYRRLCQQLRRAAVGFLQGQRLGGDVGSLHRGLVVAGGLVAAQSLIGAVGTVGDDVAR